MLCIHTAHARVQGTENASVRSRAHSPSVRGATYAANAVILTVTGLILRAAGMFFRIYIAARLGDTGMGVFQLVMTVYGLSVTLGTAGLTVVTTRVISGMMAQHSTAGEQSTTTKMVLFGFCLGIAIGLVQWAGAEPAALLWIGDATCAASLRILAPSLPFMAMAAVLRGWFMAHRQVKPNARAQMFEQAVRIALVAVLLSAVADRGIPSMCAAVVMGNTVSEALSWAFMEVCYRRAVRTLPRGASEPVWGRFAGLLAPVAGAQWLTGVLRCVENLMVPACLAAFLGSQQTALAQYGALKGMAMPVLFFPFSFIGTLAALLVPEITAAHVQRQQTALRRLVCRVLLLTLLTSILAGGMYTVFAGDLGTVLYGSTEVGFYLRVLGPLAPFMYLESMVDGILKGLDEQRASLLYTIVDSAVRIVLIWALLPQFGMKGFLFVMLVSNLLTSLLNLRRLLHVLQLRFDWRRWLFVPTAAAVAGGLGARAAAPLLQPLGAVGALCVGSLVFFIFYAFTLFATGCVKKSDFFPQKG